MLSSPLWSRLSLNVAMRVRNAGCVRRTMRSTVENILQWFAGIGTAFKKLTVYFSRLRHPPSDTAAEACAESEAEEAGADVTATESAVATPTTTATFTAAVTADAKIGQDVEVSCVVPIRPISKKFSADAIWSGRCSMISGADATTSRRRSWIAWTWPNLISTSD
jgi:hypothetical protein